MLKALEIILIVLVCLFLLTVIIYWFNLDTKLVKALEKTFTKHYDNMERDKKL